MKPAQILIGVIIAALAVTAGFWAAQAILKDQAPRHDLSATRFPVAREIQPFELIDHHSAAFDQAALQHHWSFVFFGYTYCPDVCPTTLSILNGVAQRLQDVDADVRFVMVTVDPERDTPERLAEYVMISWVSRAAMKG
jgi:protein SCO1/2